MSEWMGSLVFVFVRIMAVERELNRNRYVILFQEASNVYNNLKEEDETKGLDYYHICWLICKIIENG